MFGTADKWLYIESDAGRIAYRILDLDWDVQPWLNGTEFALRVRDVGCHSHRLHLIFFYFFYLLFIIYFIFYLLFSLVYLERKTTEPSRSLSAIAEFLVEVEYLKNGVF